MEKKLQILLLGIFAGLSIGLGGMLFLFSKQAGLNVLPAFLFSIGLLLVCGFSFYLYTGKIGFIIDKTKGFGLNLLFIYIGNIIGAVGFGLLLKVVNLKNDTFLGFVSGISFSKLIDLGNGGKSWYSLLIGSMFCGMLVYLAVAGFKKEDLHPTVRTLILIFCVALFVIAGFEHCIADMFYFSLSLPLSEFWRAILTLFIITIGNSIGSILIHSGFKAVFYKGR